MPFLNVQSSRIQKKIGIVLRIYTLQLTSSILFKYTLAYVGGLERLERISSKVFIVPTGSGLRRARRLASGWVQSRAGKVGGNWDIVDAKTTAL